MGSEMCIRDSPHESARNAGRRAPAHWCGCVPMRVGAVHARAPTCLYAACMRARIDAACASRERDTTRFAVALTVQCPSYASEWAAALEHSCPSSRPAPFRRQACCCQPRKEDINRQCGCWRKRFASSPALPVRSAARHKRVRAAGHMRRDLEYRQRAAAAAAVRARRAAMGPATPPRFISPRSSYKKTGSAASRTHCRLTQWAAGVRGGGPLAKACVARRAGQVASTFRATRQNAIIKKLDRCIVPATQRSACRKGDC